MLSANAAFPSTYAVATSYRDSERQACRYLELNEDKLKVPLATSGAIIPHLRKALIASWILELLASPSPYSGPGCCKPSPEVQSGLGPVGCPSLTQAIIGNGEFNLRASGALPPGARKASNRIPASVMRAPSDRSLLALAPPVLGEGQGFVRTPFLLERPNRDDQTLRPAL